MHKKYHTTELIYVHVLYIHVSNVNRNSLSTVIIKSRKIKDASEW